MPIAQPSMPSPRGPEAGQASLEYAGVLAVAAAVLVLVGSVTGAGGIVNGVVRGMHLALCRVTGGDCLADELEACTVRSKGTDGHLATRLTLTKLGGSLGVLREELSDGTIDVSVVGGLEGAPTAGAGAKGGVQLGGKRIGGGASASAEVLAKFDRRRTWHQPDAASADHLVRSIIEDAAANVATRGIPFFGKQARGLLEKAGIGDQDVPPPDITSTSVEVDATASAGLSFGPEVTGGLKAKVSSSQDRGTGRRTSVFELDGNVAGKLGGVLEGQGFGRAAGGAFVVTRDRAGVPLELAVRTTAPEPGALGLDLPPAVTRGSAGSNLEVVARLDLARPANRAVYDELMRALHPSGLRGLPAAASALATQLRTAARLDVTRTTRDEKTYGADLEAALGAGLGGAVDVTRSSSVLEGAWTRPAGGAWETRTDCVPDAAAV